VNARCIRGHAVRHTGAAASRQARQPPNGLRSGRPVAESAAATKPGLLDEPFGALDAQTRQSLHEFLRQVWLRAGATVPMVTHDVGEAA